MKSSSTNGKGKISRRTFLANSTALATAVGALSGVTVAQDAVQNAGRITDKSKSDPGPTNAALDAQNRVQSRRPTRTSRSSLRSARTGERAIFSLALSTGLRRGELQTLHWADLDLAHRRVHVRAKPQYAFLPKDWEERTVPFSKEVADILRRHPKVPECALLFPSPKSHINFRFMHERCKEIAERAGVEQGRMAPASFPRHRGPVLAARRHRRPHRAGMPRPRVARHDAELPGAVEGDGEAAGGDEAAVLKFKDFCVTENAMIHRQLSARPDFAVQAPSAARPVGAIP